MDDDSFNRAPFASGHALLVPIVSLALSLPTLFTELIAVGINAYEIVTRRALVTTAQTLQLPGLGVGLGCLYLVMGPLVAIVLCITQRTRAEQQYGSALLLGFRIKRLNTLALRAAAGALCMIGVVVVLSVITSFLVPQ
jgi:hypothetical protein